MKSVRLVAGKGDASPSLVEIPAQSWGNILAAMLPLVLLLLVDMLTGLLVASGLLTWESAAMQTVNIILAVFSAGVFLAALILAWRQKWPLWSATWYPFFVLVPLALTIQMLTSLDKELLNAVYNQSSILYVGLPLILAVLLYTATRRDPLRGLLATLPVLYLLWMVSNMEFVPDAIQAAVKIPSIVLICLVIVYLLRRGNWRTGLYVVLAANLAVGILFSYAGIFHGGTLPFTASGPNGVEVARSLVPQYLSLSAILIGPLFARKFRQSGLSGGSSARAGYHLALAGLLLVILANLASMSQTMDSPGGWVTSSERSIPLAAILLGLGIYLLGLFLLYRDTPFARSAAERVSGLLVVILPLAIPITFMLPFMTQTRPISDLYGIPLLWVLPQALSLSIGLAWLALSVWAVTQGAEAANPTAAPGVVSAAPSAQ